MALFNNGWITEEITKKYDSGQELKGEEALAFLCAHMSNATHNTYDAEQLFARVFCNFSIVVKKDTFEDYWD